MLEILERREVEKHHDEQHLAEAQLARSAAFAARREKVMSFQSSKVFAKSSRQQKIAVVDNDMRGIARVVSDAILNHVVRGSKRSLSPISLSRIGVTYPDPVAPEAF